MWSNLPQFCEGALLGAFLEQKEGKITYENRCQVLHVAHNIQVLARYKVENHFYWEGVQESEQLRDSGSPVTEKLPELKDNDIEIEKQLNFLECSSLL